MYPAHTGNKFSGLTGFNNGISQFFRPVTAVLPVLGEGYAGTGSFSNAPDGLDLILGVGMESFTQTYGLMPAFLMVLMWCTRFSQPFHPFHVFLLVDGINGLTGNWHRCAPVALKVPSR